MADEHRPRIADSALCQDQQGVELTGQALTDFLDQVEARTGWRPEAPANERDADAARRTAKKAAS